MRGSPPFRLCTFGKFRADPALQIGGAAVRITTMAIVRDCFGGREMARVMSYVMIVFMIVPIVAPNKM